MIITAPGRQLDLFFFNDGSPITRKEDSKRNIVTFLFFYLRKLINKKYVPTRHLLHCDFVTG